MKLTAATRKGAVHLGPGDPSGLESKRWAMATRTSLEVVVAIHNNTVRTYFGVAA